MKLIPVSLALALGLAHLALSAPAAAQSEPTTPTQVLRLDANALRLALPLVTDETWKARPDVRPVGGRVDAVTHAVGLQIDLVATVMVSPDVTCDTVMNVPSLQGADRVPFDGVPGFYPVAIANDARHSELVCATTPRGALVINFVRAGDALRAEAVRRVGLLEARFLVACAIAAERPVALARRDGMR